MTDVERGIAREKETVETMIGMYCRGNHGSKGGLCPECVLQPGDEGEDQDRHEVQRTQDDAPPGHGVQAHDGLNRDQNISTLMAPASLSARP